METRGDGISFKRFVGCRHRVVDDIISYDGTLPAKYSARSFTASLPLSVRRGGRLRGARRAAPGVQLPSLPQSECAGRRSTSCGTRRVRRRRLPRLHLPRSRPIDSDRFGQPILSTICDVAP
jgi:hypothetical protein